MLAAYTIYLNLFSKSECPLVAGQSDAHEIFPVQLLDASGELFAGGPVLGAVTSFGKVASGQKRGFVYGPGTQR